MKSINYPEGNRLGALKKEYLRLFVGKIDEMQSDWKEIRNMIPRNIRKVFPAKIRDLLTMEFGRLVRVYLSYIRLNDDNLNKKAALLFNYSGCKGSQYPAFQPKIAKFFMEHAGELQISTCYYCELSYINSYIRIGVNKRYNHFDLDHFLPKKKCPLVALSLMNFVPSCPTCNEKLKRDNELANTDENLWKRLSPSSPDFDVDKMVKIRVDGPIQFKRLQHPDAYKIRFVARNNAYRDSFVDKFHLEERYEFHKSEALRLLDLMDDYPTAKLAEISRIMDGAKTPKEIQEDLLGLKFTRDNFRIMAKFKRDILESYGVDVD